MIKSILKYISSITPRSDKLGHFFWGFWVYSITIFVFLLFALEINSYTLIPVFVVTVIKEYLDNKGFGKVELLDFVYNMIPALVMFLIIKFI